MAESRYQVIAECAYVKTADSAGVSWRLLEKGSLFFGDNTPNLQHLLDNKYAMKVGGDETGGLDASGIPASAYDVDVPANLTTTPVEKSEEQRKADAEAAEAAKAQAEVAERRAAAQAKLKEAGGTPDGRSSQAVWAEYLVSRGSRWEDVRDTTKADLIKLAEQQQ